MPGTNLTVFVGTRRGLFVARLDARRAAWSLSEPLLAGREIYQVGADPRTGTVWAASTHRVWGAHVHRSRDGGRTWETLENAPHHDDARGVDAIWQIAPGAPDRPAELWAGIQPAGLFRSRDHGETWHAVHALNDHPTAASWQPAGGALALHSIDVGTAGRITCAVSAGGAYRSDDGGATWHAINRGIRAEFLPSAAASSGHCVHRLLAHPARPDRLYQQNHCGVYRSDDAGDSWTEISAGLPSDFGYALATDPGDPDSLFVVPETSSHLRTAVDGKLRVYATRDAGRTWRALANGLPQEHAWVSVLREGLAAAPTNPPRLFLGTSGGHLFASMDGGESWSEVAAFLPRILSVGAALLD